MDKLFARNGLGAVDYAKMGFSLLLGSLLLGCTSISPKECSTSDWLEIGKASAVEGETFEELTREYVAPCKNLGVQPDVALLQKGFEEGLTTFCTHRSGFELGEKNKKYKDTCPSASEEEFLRGYKSGKLQYRQNQSLKNQSYNKRGI